MSEPNIAELLVVEGNELDRLGNALAAEQKYLDAARHDPSWSAPFYNLGLLCKYQRRWAESLAYNERATELAPEDVDAWWNLGIAATAVGAWDTARRAWVACGLTPPPGDGPPDFNLGHTPIRLDPDGDAEVVWAQRVDPARARIVSIPLPSSAYNWGDMILNDGAPEGGRVVDGREYLVFNALERLQSSPYRKFVLELATSDRAAIAALEDLAHEMDAAAEDWGQSTRTLCKACSLGTPHEHPDASHAPAHPACGLAARDAEHADRILAAWLSQQPQADLVTWYEATN